MAEVRGHFLLAGPRTSSTRLEVATITSRFDRVVLDRAHFCEVRFPSNRSIKIQRECEFSILADGVIAIQRGHWSHLAFAGSPHGYKVHLPSIVLGIQGTSIVLQISASEESVWVEEGVVAWESPERKTNGVLSGGMGLTVLPTGIASLSVSPWLDKGVSRHPKDPSGAPPTEDEGQETSVPAPRPVAASTTVPAIASTVIPASVSVASLGPAPLEMASDTHPGEKRFIGTTDDRF